MHKLRFAVVRRLRAAGLIVSCRHASIGLSRRMDESLPFRESARLHLHVVVCAPCRNLLRNFELQRAAMRALRGE